ncbi:hypothetical protein [Bacillus sp. UMB0728]|uniref:hypothetical protein n=1 Tax=Bacillus sp. UMB0728 TaxID=2066052 RepID=UPI000C7755EB|nr:hypothetical protein [Bacillus sp. UMB0728]PLR70537.1 hypothetical protein CYJ37_23680 [Bacillus sp. UMB0728]
MSNVSLLERVKKLESALHEISALKYSSFAEIPILFDQAQSLAAKALSESEGSFFVLKQFEGRGPLYKVEISKTTLEVLSAEEINEIPAAWSAEDFYSLLAEGKRLDIKKLIKQRGKEV